MRKPNSFKPDALTLLKAKQERLLAQKARTDQALEELTAEMAKANERHGNNQFHMRSAGGRGRSHNHLEEETKEPVR